MKHGWIHSVCTEDVCTIPTWAIMKMVTLHVLYLYIIIWFCQKVHNAYVGLKASLWWPVHIIKSVAKHKLSRYTPPQTQHQSFFRDSSLLVCTRDGFRLWLPLELPAPIKNLKASHVSTDKGKKTFVIVSHSSNFFHHIL